MSVTTLSPKSSILYFSTTSLDDTSNAFDSLSAHEKIGRACATAFAQMKQGGLENQTPVFFGALKKLGIEKDEPAAFLALNVLRSLTYLRARPHNEQADISGIYFLYNPSITENPVMMPASLKPNSCKVSKQKTSTKDVEFVYKVGTARLETERLVAKLAHWTGLQEHVTSIFPFVLQNHETDPNFKENDGGMIVQLLNGREKEHLTIPKIMAGGVQSFVSQDKKVHSSEDYTKMVMLALISGLRDGKLDGIVNSADHHVLFDADDSFPIEIDPPIGLSVKDFKKRTVAATDLPFLEHPDALKDLSLCEVAHLAELVSQWDISEIGAKLSAEPILFFDRNAEKTPLNKKRKDDTGALFISLESENEHLINGDQTDIDINDPNGQKTILNQKQVSACMERIRRVKEFITQKHTEQQASDSSTNVTFTPLDLVKAVDPFFKIYSNALTTIPERDPTLTLDKILGRFTIAEIVGRRPLETMARNLRLNANVLEGVSSYMFEAYKTLPRVRFGDEVQELPAKGKENFEIKSPQNLTAEKKQVTPKKALRVHLQDVSPRSSKLG